MKKNIYKTIIAAMCILPSCSDYLNVVPDKSFSMESIFSTRTEAYEALAKCYSYLPDDARSGGRTVLGDELINPSAENLNNNFWLPIRIMERKMTADNPIMGTWSGTGAGKPLYVAINTCNIFISMIEQVKGMDATEQADWKAQVTFLKAYYHWLLLQQYGPIIIMDKVTSPDDDPATLYNPRIKIDECFDYIVRTLDLAIPDLVLRRTGSDLGQIDQLGAAAIKARVLLFRASPFYSGNGDYSGFLDHDGKPFFPQDDAATTKIKWDDAVKAIDTAIILCENNRVELYKYDRRILPDDIEDDNLNHDNLQTLYDLRMVICDRWNKELIWGNSNVFPAVEDMIFCDANIMLPPGFNYGGRTNATYFCRNYLGATYKTLEQYYTKNGLPLDEDTTFDRSTMHELTLTPGPLTDAVGYLETRGILQPDAQTIKLYLNREPRFYANVGITGGYWRAHTYRIPTTFYSGGPGGRQSNPANNHFWSAIGAQKLVHIESKTDQRSIVSYPTPIIRLADLYLMKAEALNEYNNGPTPDVYVAINKVRKRAGIPPVETAWSSTNARTQNKHTYYAGMKEIIAQERKIELAFEGSLFWDMLRTKKATEEFSKPVTGWDALSTGENFFKRQILQSRLFTLRDCLWPIDNAELDKNPNLIQNPGW
ncbi:RagB/SusD domain-containing protein [Candidatus Symbiothrix dinenymphae]|nr:RagB/SusD domain-containing protein [Candidatus Symbiothrix dinenymphae]